MSRVIRDVSKNDQSANGGSAVWRVNGETFIADNTSVYTYNRRLRDLTGTPHTDGVLWLEKHDRSGIPYATGSAGDPGDPDPEHSYFTYTNYVVGRFRGDLGYSGFPGWPHDHYPGAVTHVLAETNPSRPNIVPGALLQDLWTLPKLLNELGSLIRSGNRAIGHKGVANTALAAKFGWVPLMNDVSDLLGVLENVARRNDELKRLFSEGGLRRRVRLGRKFSHSTSYPTVESGILGSPGFITYREDLSSQSDAWATVRWLPNGGPGAPTSDAERLNLARRTVLGATASGIFASSWDLIPWTWLLGWVVNIRDYVLAHGNTVPASPVGNVNLMMHTEDTFDYTPHYVPDWVAMGSGNTTNSWKTRIPFPATPTVSAHLPYITADRLSTLALLAVQRIRR
ncbi:MAG: putative maturation protein [Alehxovirus pseudonemoriscola]|uniref:Maturation protein n=1 Tax=Leviviridae sp. TaxID=2027243 RepID=A0ABY3SS50_9VIRU|nr:MAG: putative maturation protein [Leviviridae sp.]